MKTITNMLIIQLVLVSLTIILVLTNYIFPELAHLKLNNTLISILMGLQTLGWLSMVIYLLNLPKRKRK